MASDEVANREVGIYMARPQLWMNPRISFLGCLRGGSRPDNLELHARLEVSDTDSDCYFEEGIHEHRSSVLDMAGVLENISVAVTCQRLHHEAKARISIDGFARRSPRHDLRRQVMMASSKKCFSHPAHLGICPHNFQHLNELNGHAHKGTDEDRASLPRMMA